MYPPLHLHTISRAAPWALLAVLALPAQARPQPLAAEPSQKPALVPPSEEAATRNTAGTRDLSGDVQHEPAPPPGVLDADASAMRGELPGLMFDVSDDGAVWARGRGYKASFSGGEATIIPFFGSDAPRNHPIVLRASAATLDGAAMTTRAAERAVRTERTVRMDRGAFVEEYALEEERLEQRFVFDDLPRRGDLVVRIDVETDLAVADRGESLRFANELGHVDYGQAFAFDADGTRIEIERAWVDGAIELTVPRSFVAEAALPLTIDPFLTFFTVSLATNDELFPDVAYDASTNRWCVTWVDVFSSIDFDVFAEVMTSTGGSLGVVTIDFTTDYWETPKIANNNFANQFLVVAGVDPAPVTANFGRVKGRTVDASTLAVGSQFTISPVGGTDRYRPDVGGDPYPLSPFSRYCVVWQHDVNSTRTDIERQMVNQNQTLHGPFVPVVSNQGRNDHPAISSSLGAYDPTVQERWTVAWQFTFSSTDRDIYARQIDYNGAFLTGIVTIDASTADETEPSVATVLGPIAGHRYGLITYQRELTIADEDVYGVLISGSSILDQRNLSADHAPTQSRLQLGPKTDSDGDQFLVGHVEFAPATSYDVWISDYYVSGNQLVPCAVHENFAGAPVSESDFAVHSRASSGGAAERYFGTWVFDAISTGYDIQGGLWDGCTGGAVTTFCAGDGSGFACPCGNTGAIGNGCASSANPAGARLSALGNARLGADTLVLVGQGMPSSSSCLYFQGTAPSSGGSGTVFGDGKRCAGGTVVRLGTKTNAGGVSQYPGVGDPGVGVRGQVPALGATRYYQAWYRNAAVFCTSSTFNLTNGLMVVWAP